MAENVFTRKIGPLPAWAWTAIVGAIVVVYALWKRRSASSAAGSATPSPSADGTTADGSSLVPPPITQFYGAPETETDTTNVRVTTPPDQDRHRQGADTDTTLHHDRSGRRGHPTHDQGKIEDRDKDNRRREDHDKDDRKHKPRRTTRPRSRTQGLAGSRGF